MNKRTDMPMVGTSVFIQKEGRYLLAMRLNSHNSGKYQTPGGHLEYMETLEDGAKREVMEETGLTIDNVKVLTVIDDMFPEEKLHYATVYMTADYVSGEVNGRVPNPEPECHGDWNWYDLDNFPVPIWDSVVKAANLLP